MANRLIYDLIKKSIAQKNISTDELENLKDTLEEEIGSSRRLSLITTLEDLLDVLERRDEINESKLFVLKYIADHLNDEEINNAISQYSPIDCDNELENLYALERIDVDMKEQLRVSRIRNAIAPNSALYEETHTRAPNNPIGTSAFEGKKRETIYKLISTEIGRRWRDFGREIGIREGEMDNLEVDYSRDSKLKVRKMLELYEDDEREDPKRIVLSICNALESCRRKDLSKRIQEIMIR